MPHDNTFVISDLSRLENVKIMNDEFWQNFKLSIAIMNNNVF